MRIKTVTYLMQTTKNSVQMSSETMPTAFSTVGAAFALVKQVLIVYSGLVPMSPKTTPSAAMARADGSGRRNRSATHSRDLARCALARDHCAVNVSHVVIRCLFTGKEHISFRERLDSGEFRVLPYSVVRIRSVVPRIVRPHVEVRDARVEFRDSRIDFIEFADVLFCDGFGRRTVRAGGKHAASSTGKADENSVISRLRRRDVPRFLVGKLHVRGPVVALGVPYSPTELHVQLSIRAELEIFDRDALERRESHAPQIHFTQRRKGNRKAYEVGGDIEDVLLCGKRADQRAVGALAQCDERRIGLDGAGGKCCRHPRGELVVAALDV